MLVGIHEFCFNDYIKAGTTRSAENLKRLAESPSSKVRLRVAENPWAPPEVLASLIRDSNCEVRIAAGSNPATPAHLRYSLVYDEDLNVRLGLAQEISTPVDMLNALAEDPNPHVSCQAAITRACITTQSCHPRFQSEQLRTAS